MSRVKIIVHVPPESADEVRRTLGEAGAGIVGNYTHCSFSFSYSNLNIIITMRKVGHSGHPDICRTDFT